MTANAKLKDKTNNGYAMYWTISAVQCYMLGCQCAKCEMPNFMETKCVMKVAVMELVRKFGKPSDELIKTAKEEMENKNERILLIQN